MAALLRAPGFLTSYFNSRRRNLIIAAPGVVFTADPGGRDQAQTSEALTGHYNNSRNSANLHETILTPSNVSASTFGLLFTQTVDANYYTQRLWGLTNGVTHNVVFVATIHNTVYAFDADTLQAPLWSVTLGSRTDAGIGALRQLPIPCQARELFTPSTPRM